MNLSIKVALVTGGASGIGESCVEEFLQNGIKGVIIADINEQIGDAVAKKLNDKYGNERTIFVKTDVSDKSSLENAFHKGVEKYNNLDILVNCAGISNEITWEKTLQVNLLGTTYGCLLAINNYFPKYKSGSEVYIININSIVGIVPLGFQPHYSSSKSAVIALTRSFGINKTITDAGVHVMAVCPGATETPGIMNYENSIIYKECAKEEISQSIHLTNIQKPSSVAKAVMKILQEPKNGKVLFVSEGKMYNVIFPKLEDIIIPIS